MVRKELSSEFERSKRGLRPLYKECPPGMIWRFGHNRVLKSGEVKEYPGKCIQAWGKNKYAERKCPPGMMKTSRGKCVWKKFEKFSGQEMVKRKSPVRKSRARKSPPKKSRVRKSSVRKSEAGKCKQGMVWRKAHSRTLRNGEVIRIPGKCIKSRSPMKRGYYRRRY